MIVRAVIGMGMEGYESIRVVASGALYPLENGLSANPASYR